MPWKGYGDGREGVFGLEEFEIGESGDLKTEIYKTSNWDHKSLRQRVQSTLL